MIAGSAALVATACAPPAIGRRQARNILLIVADDIGFTDLGIYGSEIPTPNLDRLARRGTYFNDLHTGMTCSPTRAMLMSGVDHHLAGLGNMAEDLAPNQRGRAGYEGYLNFSVAALPEILRQVGYRTFMAGKWHLGMTPETGPAARGFDRSFAMLQGGAGHFASMMPMVGPGKARYSRDGQAVEELPEDFYSTQSFTNELLAFLKEGPVDTPFFGYLAFTAPHWPIQAPRSSIDAFRGVYDAGYDALFEARLASGKTAAVIPPTARGARRAVGGAAWSNLSAQERAYEARRMEAYAAMISDLDHAVGRVMEHLQATGQHDDTLIMVLSDNGYEGHDMRSGFPEAAAWSAICCDNSLDNIGAPDSYVWMGPDWSRASTPAFRLYKGFPTEGGTRVPAIIAMPGVAGTGLNTGRAHVKDLFATMLDWSGAVLDPGWFPDRQLHRPDGRSLMPVLTGASRTVHRDDEPFAQELFGKRAIRMGEWKAMLLPRPYGTEKWQLFHLSDDLAETTDLAAQEPAMLSDLVARWNGWAADHNIILPDVVTGY